MAKSADKVAAKAARKAKKASQPKVSPIKSLQIYLQNNTGKKLAKKVVIAIILYLVLFDLAFVFIYPFLTMISDAFKTDSDLINSTVKWIPTQLYFTNFKVAFSELNYLKFLKNSVLEALIATVGHTLVCSFVGYGFARYNFKGKGVLFIGVILSMLVPVQVLVIPLYITFSNWHWLNSWLPLLVPCFFGFGLRGGFYVFLFRQFFMSLPWEMEEAARIDGCGPIKTFLKIMLPMSRSSVLVAVVLSIVWHWNDYFEPNIYLSLSPGLQLLPSKLPGMYEQLAQVAGEADEVAGGASIVINQANCMAATFLVILPLLIAYMFVQKQFMEGVERSGLTGM